MDDMGGFEVRVLGDHSIECVVNLALYFDVICLQASSSHDVFLVRDAKRASETGILNRSDLRVRKIALSGPIFCRNLVERLQELLSFLCASSIAKNPVYASLAHRQYKSLIDNDLELTSVLVTLWFHQNPP